LQFPRDHGAHPDFRSEWWYFTGNLADAAGRRFGFQFTVFRFALAPAATRRASAFATRQAWMAHLAITDVDAQRFHAFERFARGAAGLAGAQPHPFAVWLEDWRAEALPAAHAGAEPFPLRLRAGDGEVALDLVLQPGRARVLHGEQGLSRKSAAAGNASYYYSYTRIPASGELRTPAGRFQVAGEAWMDREWSTSALAADQRGWDWFSLQLDDGRDLMFYRLRDAAGGMHAFSAGVLVPPRGQVTHLNAADVALTPLRHWRSPAGGRYPVAWRLRSGQLDLQVHALLDAQEHRAAFRYWEGAVAVRGRDGPRAIAGHGYLEMTAY
jgi:predicted secreted hydrolase